MVECVLHIGVEKTGSTSIQTSLSKSRPRLLACGVLYPEALGEKNQVKAYAYASETGVDELKSQWGLDNPTSIAQFRSRLREQLAQEITLKKPKTICVSNEHCSSRLLLNSEIERLRALLEAHCSSIKIVIYLRRQGDALRSAYSTYVKTGGTAVFGPPGPEEINNKYNYDVILDRWASVFGEHNMDVRILDRETLVDGDVVTDFFTKLGVGANEVNLEKDLNRSLGWVGSEFLRKFNAFVPYSIDNEFNPARGNVQEIIEGLPDVPFEGDASIMDAFDNAMIASNERVRLRYFPDLKGPLFPTVVGRSGDLQNQPVTAEDLMRVMAHLWEFKQKQVIRLRNRLAKEVDSKTPSSKMAPVMRRAPG